MHVALAHHWSWGDPWNLKETETCLFIAHTAKHRELPLPICIVRSLSVTSPFLCLMSVRPPYLFLRDLLAYPEQGGCAHRVREGKRDRQTEEGGRERQEGRERGGREVEKGKESETPTHTHTHTHTHREREREREREWERCEGGKEVCFSILLNMTV
jgi:hypothetical protein